MQLKDNISKDNQDKVKCHKCGEEAICYNYDDKYGVVYLCPKCRVIFEKNGELRIKLDKLRSKDKEVK